MALVNANPAPTFRKLKRKRKIISRHRVIYIEYVGTDVRIKGRTDVHIRAPVEIMLTTKVVVCRIVKKPHNKP